MKITLIIEDEDADGSAAIKLDRILKGIKIMAATLDSIINKVSAQTTALDSLNIFVEGLQQQIKDLKLTPADQAKIDALFVQLTDNDERIAAAFTENTQTTEPPDPTPPVEPVEQVQQI